MVVALKLRYILSGLLSTGITGKLRLWVITSSMRVVESVLDHTLCYHGVALSMLEGWSETAVRGCTENIENENERVS